MNSVRPSPEAPSVSPDALLEGPRVRLRAPTPADYDSLHAWAANGEGLHRWRYRGHTPSPEEFGLTLWQGILVQFIIEDRRARRPLALASIYGADHRHRYASLAVLVAPQFHRQAWVFEGVARLVSYTFRLWDFRKLYAETVEFNYEQLRQGVGRFFEEEARLRDREYHDGRYWDTIFLGISREHWRKVEERYPAFFRSAHEHR